LFRFRVGDKADHLRRDDRLTAPRVAFRGVGDLAGESGRSWCQQGFPPSTDRAWRCAGAVERGDFDSCGSTARICKAGRGDSAKFAE